MALSQAQTSEIAMMIKKSNPNIGDVELAQHIQKINDMPNNSSDLNTELKSGYAGSSQEAANPTNPQASAISQFDPNQLKAAQQKYLELNRDQTASRYMANLGASMGSANGRLAVNDLLTNADNLNKINSIGGQEALQAQATAGLAAATSVQNMNKIAGEYRTSQQKAQEDINQARQKTQTGAMDVKFQRDLNDSNSPMTNLVRTALANQAATDPSLANDPAFQQAMKNPSLNAKQLLQFAKPGVLDALKEKAGVASTNAATAKTQAETPGVAAESKIKTGVANTVVPADKQLAADRESLAIIKSEYDKTPANHPDKMGLFREMNRLAQSINQRANSTGDKIQMPAGSNMSISAGGATIAPSPLTTGGQTNAAKEDAVNREQSKVATQYGLDSLTASLAKRSGDAVADGKFSSTGNIQELMTRRFSPGDAGIMRSDINRFVDGKIAYATAAGQPAPDRAKEVERIMQMTPRTFQNEVLGFNEQVGRQEKRQAAQSQYLKEKGTSEGFSDQSIKDSVYMYNPSTGARGFVSPANVSNAIAHGYKQLNQLNR